MPTPRQHTDPAAKQKAYRERQEVARVTALAAKNLPPAPAISTMPGERRWAALTVQAQSALETVQREMQDYYDERSETWQEGEKGDEFQERLDRLDVVLADLGDL